jgi:endonuclease YncB( thermonuclease family)
LIGRVVGVADGDTLTVLTAERQQHRVRLTGIEAPEKRQGFGQVSKQHLSALAYDKTVSVVFHKRDRYQRILGKVLVNGVDAGLEQIRSGLAWHYNKYEREQSPEDRVAYARVEEKARAERRGLWRDPKPVPPWNFRRR